MSARRYFTAMSQRNLPHLRAHLHERRTLREIMPTSSAMLRLNAADEPISRDRPRCVSAMTELFVPLDRLLGSGGDPPLSLDPLSRANGYGSWPVPCPRPPSFA